MVGKTRISFSWRGISMLGSLLRWCCMIMFRRFSIRRVRIRVGVLILGLRLSRWARGLRGGLGMLFPLNLPYEIPFVLYLSRWSSIRVSICGNERSSLKSSDSFRHFLFLQSNLPSSHMQYLSNTNFHDCRCFITGMPLLVRRMASGWRTLC